MADENINIIVTAIDLASAKLREIEARLGSTMRNMRGSTEGLEQSYGRLRRAEQEVIDVSEGAERGFRQLGQGQQRLQITSRSLGSETQRLGSTVRETDRNHQALARTVGEVSRQFRQFEQRVGSLTPAIDRHGRSVESARGHYKVWGDYIHGEGFEVFEGFRRQLGRIGDELETVDTHLKRKRSDTASAGRGFRDMARAVLAAGGAFATVTTAVLLGGNAIGAITGSTVALTAALGALAGTLITIPAGFAILGGAVAATMTIFRPALAGIGDFLAAVDKAKAPGAAALGSGADRGQQVADAERALRRARQDALISQQDDERRLHELRIENAQQERDAERAVADAERQGLQQVIDLERQLHDMRVADRQAERQLELTLQDAQASAAAEALRGGAGQEIAGATVQEAQDDLNRLRRENRTQEAGLQGQLHDARVQRVDAVRAAELRLQRTRQENARQIRDLERQIFEDRLHNARSIADAERAVQQARVAGTTELDQQAAILADLSPLQRRLALEVQDIRDRWKGLTEDARQGFLRELLHDLNILESRLPRLANIVSRFAATLTGFLRRAVTDINRPRTFQRNVQFLDAQNRNARVLGGGTIDALHAFDVFATSRGARAFLRWLSDATAQWAHMVRQITNAQDRADGFTGFFVKVRRSASLTFDIIKNLSVALFNIFSLSFRPGAGLLQSIDEATKRFRDFTESVGGRRSIRRFINDAVESMRRWADILGPLAERLGEVIVLTTQFTGPITLLSRFINFILNNPIGRAVLAPLIAFAAQLIIIGTILPGNQRVLKVFGETIKALAAPIGALVGRLVALYETEIILADGTAVAGKGFALFGRDVLIGTSATEAAEVGLSTLTITIGATEIALGTLIATFAIIAAAVAILVILYFKWKPFHDIVDATGHLIERVTIPIFHFLGRIIGGLVDILQFVIRHWQAFLLIFGGPLGAAVIFVYNHFEDIKHIVGAAMSWVFDKVRGVWHDLTSWIRGDSTLARAFQFIGDKVSDIWGGIWDAIVGVARDAWNLFARGVNFVLNILGSKDRLPLVHWGEQQKQKPSQKLVRAPHPAAAGGRFDAVQGGLLHVVEGGYPEYILSTDPKYRTRTVGLLAQLLKETGLLPGMAGGGIGAPITPYSGPSLSGEHPALAWLARLLYSRGVPITSTTGGVHAPNSYHYLGEAIDMAPYATAWNLLYPRRGGFVELFGPRGLFHSGRQFFDGALQAQHMNHIHAAFTGSLQAMMSLMGAGGGGGFGLGFIGDALGWVKDHIPGFGALDRVGGVIGKAIGAMFTFARDKVLDWVENTPGMLARVAEYLGGGLLSAAGGVISFFSSSQLDSVNAIDRAKSIKGRDPRSNMMRGQLLASVLGWRGSEWFALEKLWNRESGWRWNAENPSSGAYGIPQSLPASKMAAAGADWRTNPLTQIAWGLSYIRGRYGSPSAAWAHEVSQGWYDLGGPVGGGVYGTAVPIMAHVGEWVLNRSQQARLAAMFGSWDRARDYLFTTPAIPGMSLYGGTTASRRRTMQGSGVEQTFILHEVQPQTDIDYVMRMAEMHMRSR